MSPKTSTTTDDGATITVSLKICNTYPGNGEIITYVTDAVIPAPPPPGPEHTPGQHRRRPRPFDDDSRVRTYTPHLPRWHGLAGTVIDRADEPDSAYAYTVSFDHGPARIAVFNDDELEADEALDQDWANQYIHPFTGTGRARRARRISRIGRPRRTNGNACYDVEITACSDPRLIGKTIQFGY